MCSPPTSTVCRNGNDAMDAGSDPQHDDGQESHELSRRQRDAAVAGWSSFLIAAVGAMVLFAFVDPMTLVEVTEPPLPVERMTGYAIGFFFLWILTAASAAL